MKKNTWIGPLLIAVFLAGLSLVLYPSFSDYWNATRQSRAIAVYVEQTDSMEDESKQEMLHEAERFNAALLSRSNPYMLPDELRLSYDNVLDTTGTGIMAYVDIPAIKVLLPIYHGTSDGVLSQAIGHIEWSSLPVGGQGTHTVVSGHRGLPSAKLFTDLDALVVGDLFMLQVLDETRTYEVDQILIVEPEDVKDLVVEPNKDYCTLVTCTPYGVNTHRLLVRGHRVENQAAARTVRLISEAMQIEPMVVAPIVAIPLLALLFVVYALDDALWGKKRKN